MQIAGIGKLILGTTTAVALLVTSMHTAGATTDAPPLEPSYSGEELFEGLMLNNGPLAEEHPETLLDPALAGELGGTTADVILSLIDERHPHAFDDFEAAVGSGDPYAVRQGLYDGRDVLEDVLSASRGGSPGTITPMADTICSLTACGVQYVAVAVFLIWAIGPRLRSVSAFENADTPSQTLELDDWVARIIDQVG